MDKLREAAREVVRQHSIECLSDKTVEALREALAGVNISPTEQAEQEPVAEVVLRSHKVGFGRTDERKDIVFLADVQVGQKLYAAPLAQQVTPVTQAVRTKDLTDDEIEELMLQFDMDDDLCFARAVIAADRAKNNLCDSANAEEKNK